MPRRCPNRRRADRAAGQRRRGHDVHVLAVRQRRHLQPDRHLRASAPTSTWPRCWCRTASTLAVPLAPRRRPRTGVNIRKKSRPTSCWSSTLLDRRHRYDQLYLSNYATPAVRTSCRACPASATSHMLGQRDYSIASGSIPTSWPTRNLTAADVVGAIKRAEHRRWPPARSASRRTRRARLFSAPDRARPAGGRGAVRDTSSCETRHDGRIVRSKRRGPVEWRQEPGRQSAHSMAGPRSACDLSAARRQRPRHRRAAPRQDGGAARQTSRRASTTRSLTTPPRTSASRSTEVFKTLRDAIVLVALVVLVFLQNWRSALIPLVAVPVAIIGTFAVMAAVGFSLNNLTLFGLVLAIGIVVDDAIVVVEAVEHHIEHGLTPREADDQGDGRGVRAGDRRRPGAHARCSCRAPSSAASPASSSASSP